MDTKKIIAMSKKSARRYKSSSQFDDLVSEGVLAALERLKLKPDCSEANLWQAINWAQWKYLNVSLQDVKIPENLVRIAKGLGTKGVDTNYTKESIDWVKLLLSKGNSDYTQEDLSFGNCDFADKDREESVDHIWSTATSCLTGEEFSLFHSYFSLGSKQKDLAVSLDISDRGLRYKMDAIVRKVRENL